MYKLNPYTSCTSFPWEIIKTNLNLVKGEQTKAMMTYSFNEQKNANLMETIELTQERELYILYQVLQLFNFF